MERLTVEDIERQQRTRRIAFRTVLLLILLVVCILIAWLITRVGYSGIEQEALLRLTDFSPNEFLIRVRA